MATEDMAAFGMTSDDGTEATRSATGASTPPSCPYPLTAEERNKRKSSFFNSIDPDAVCRLASQHRGSMPCRMFHGAAGGKERANGSFNVCYFVEFPDSTRWVVRIPIVPAIQDVWAKLQSEVATMR